MAEPCCSSDSLLGGSSPGASRPSRPQPACPDCGTKGKSVPGQTVRALVAVSLREVHDLRYYFCPSPDCPVVYFPSTAGRTFRVDAVREPVYQKRPVCDDVPVCYCFRHTVGAIMGADESGRTAIVDDINTGIKAGQCACDLRNPQGSCCLGNVLRLIKDSGQIDPTS